MMIGVGAGIDLLAPDANADPHALFHRLRAQGPIHWCDAQHAWLVVRHDAVVEGFKAAWLSSDRMPFFERAAAHRDARFERVVDLLRGWMVFRDPPAHTRLRDPVRQVFTPRRLASMEPLIEATAEGLLDSLDGDLVATFTRPLPALVIADLLAIPRDDRAAFQEWSDELATVVFAAESRAHDTERASAAAEQFFDYFGELVEHRRRHPGDDVLSALVTASGTGAPDPAELVGACTLLLFAGHETTAGLLANGTVLLLGHDEERARLADDPSLWPTAVDELLRMEGPSKVMFRKVADERDWYGQRLRVGDTVMLGILAADRDPAVFADPDRLDVGRDPNPHIAFGWGLHHCLGAALARLEARVALRRLFERFPDLAMAAEPHWGGGVIGRGVAPVQVRIG
jgi:cytochrome P450